MSRFKKVIIGGAVVVAVLMGGVIVYGVGCPVCSGFRERAWTFGDVDMAVSQEFGGLDLFYNVRLVVRDGESESAYYVDHEDTFWWTADIVETAPGEYLVRKNGGDYLVYDHNAGMTTHLRDDSRRSALTVSGL